MRNFLLATTLIVATTPAIVQAQDFSISAGATLTSRYMSNGAPLSEGIAFQPYVEVETNGFYAGLWASNTSLALAGGRAEVDLYFGYRNEIGIFSYDLGYARYIMLRPRSSSGEIILSLGVQATETLALGTRFAYDPKNEILNSRATVGLGITDAVSADLAFGKINKGGATYWVAGVNYQITPDISATLAWHDSNQTRGRAVLSFDYSFSFN